MLSSDVREFVIRPALKVTNLWSESAELLIYGTGLIETGYNHLIQIGNPINGGLGFWQTERSDYADILRWLRFPANRILSNSLMSASFYAMIPPAADILINDIRFAALICRIHYLRIPDPLPDAKDADGMANYYKIHYNSLDGKANPEHCIEIFKGLIDGTRY